jgi:hypothetical protein
MESKLVTVAALALALAFAPACAQAAKPDTLVVCGARIDVTFDGPTPDLPRQAFLDWIDAGARAVVAYFGRFPVAHYRVRVLTSGTGRGVRAGTTWSYGGVHTDVRVGRQVTESDLEQDWVMTHEMVHLSFPHAGDDHAWVTEGVATYVEPLARSFVGTYPIRAVWSDLVEGLPKGMPGSGDRGLDRSDSWGRTYWGGALFYLRADVEIRRRTQNRMGLIDALRGILASGGNDEAEWTPTRAFAVGDAATGVPVLQELWAEMGPKPDAPHLDLLWKRLGVPRAHDAPFDDTAPDTAIRKAIGAPPPKPACGGVVPDADRPPPATRD